MVQKGLKSNSSFKILRLKIDYVVKHFDCGDADLNDMQIHIDIFIKKTYIINGWFSRFRKNLPNEGSQTLRKRVPNVGFPGSVKTCLLLRREHSRLIL